MTSSREASMSYLKDFRIRIQNNDYPSLLKLWEEYCYGDQPDAEELILILQEIKATDMAKPFGLQVEKVLPFWREVKDSELAHKALQLVFDLQTTNTEELAALALAHLQGRYPNDPLFSEKLRLVGLRNKDQFQGCLRNFDLLSHIKKGNFVFHTAGWGTGEILDYSLVREEMTLEFEYVIGTQQVSFEKAFKTLLPLPPGHFYARRFGNPDRLEEEARDNPNEIIRLLLRDLGPKNAAEIKEELNDLVIPSQDWNRWWQTARARIKKDTKIESPKELKDPFRLREEDLPHEVALHKALEAKPGVNATIQMVYTFLRDFPETLKNQDFRTSLETRVKEELEHPSLTDAQKLQLLFFLEDLHVPKAANDIEALITEMQKLTEIIPTIQVLSFQKRSLQVVRKHRKDWKEIFLDLLFMLDINLLRDYILQELSHPDFVEDLKKKLSTLLINPLSYPEALVWYFQKTIGQAKYPFSDHEGKNRFFEATLVLLDYLGQKPESRDLAKKVIALLTADRYKIVRDILQHSKLNEVKEYLLLATKCQSLTDHDIKILYSLAEVVHPSIAHLRKDRQQAGTSDENILWTTQEGYTKTQQRIQQIATVETVHNAREIEAARALGDLRENAEFKAALERRDRLQGELKFLSDQINRTRILTSENVSIDEVGVGSIVYCKDSKGSHAHFTLLGPWDADPENNILSFQSKLAQAMKGKTPGETFTFQSETYTIVDIRNYFDREKPS